MEWKTQKSYTDYEFSATCYGKSEAQFEDVTANFKQENILKKIVIAEAELGGENLEVKEMDEAKKIVKVSTLKKTESGYLWSLIKNQETSAKYKEVVSYSKFEGLQLMAPFAGQ